MLHNYRYLDYIQGILILELSGHEVRSICNLQITRDSRRREKVLLLLPILSLQEDLINLNVIILERELKSLSN